MFVLQVLYFLLPGLEIEHQLVKAGLEGREAFHDDPVELVNQFLVLTSFVGKTVEVDIVVFPFDQGLLLERA